MQRTPTDAHPWWASVAPARHSEQPRALRCRAVSRLASRHTVEGAAPACRSAALTLSWRAVCRTPAHSMDTLEASAAAWLSWASADSWACGRADRRA